MSGYTHIGPVDDNGYVDTSQIITDNSTLRVVPGDDGFHLNKPVIGNFEWWYFDVIDIKQNILLKIVTHIGTNPLKTSLYPQLAVSVSTPDTEENITRKYEFDDFSGASEYCRIQLKNEFEARVEHDAHTKYIVMVNLPEFSAELQFDSEIEGWKPAGDSISYSRSRRSAHFMWIIPCPKARVNGYFIFGGRRYEMDHVTGYHDHNYCSVNRKRPLHLDSLVNKWCWGKCYCEDFTMIFMDTYFRTNRLRSLFLARGNKIMHSSNNLIDLKVLNTGYDDILGSVYPSSLSVDIEENEFSLRAVIDAKKIADRKDLIEEVPSILKWFIKRFVARPVYYGFIAQVSMEIDNKELNGFGNYEYMAFRT
jgi:hypothetical protein